MSDIPEKYRGRSAHEVPDLAPILPTACLGRSWTPTMVLGAMVMVPAGEWRRVPLIPSTAAHVMAYRCRAVGLDATSSAGVCYVSRPAEPREPLSQRNRKPFKRAAAS